MNFTFISLSLSSFYSTSPIFTGHRTLIKHSNFQFFTQIVFYNPVNLELYNSKFSNGLGSLLISESNKRNIFDDTSYKISDIFYTLSNFSKISSMDKSLVIISDCIFHEITLTQADRLISINGNPTTYITSCLFSSCKSSNGIFKLNAKAITISHICVSNLESTGQVSNKIFFLDVESPRNSFIQFIYSTIFGNNKDTNSKNIINLGQSSAIRYQCINISHMTQNGNNAESILKILSPS